MNTKSFEKIINEAWENKSQINSKSNKKLLKTINQTIELLDSGKIRVAEKKNSSWITNQWVKKAILLSFRKLLKGLILLGLIKLKGKLKSGTKKN